MAGSGPVARLGPWIYKPLQFNCFQTLCSQRGAPNSVLAKGTKCGKLRAIYISSCFSGATWEMLGPRRAPSQSCFALGEAETRARLRS